MVLIQTNLTELEKENIVLKTDREIEQCKFAIIAVNNPRNVVIENLGDSVNTIYPEYASVVSRDEKMIVFNAWQHQHFDPFLNSLFL